MVDINKLTPEDILSAANVYCTKSFVPTEKKSTSLANL